MGYESKYIPPQTRRCAIVHPTDQRRRTVKLVNQRKVARKWPLTAADPAKRSVDNLNGHPQVCHDYKVAHIAIHMYPPTDKTCLGRIQRVGNSSFLHVQLLAVLRHIHLVWVSRSNRLRMDTTLIFPFSSFSHHRVTIPPPGWSTAAHRHGVKMLGVLYVQYYDCPSALLTLIVIVGYSRVQSPSKSACSSSSALFPGSRTDLPSRTLTQHSRYPPITRDCLRSLPIREVSTATC